MSPYTKEQFLIWAECYLNYQGIRVIVEGGRPDWIVGRLVLAAYIAREKNNSYLSKDMAAIVMETKHPQTTDKYIKTAVEHGFFDSSPENLEKGHLVPTNDLVKIVEDELSDRIDMARMCLNKTIRIGEKPKDGLAWFKAA